MKRQRIRTTEYRPLLDNDDVIVDDIDTYRDSVQMVSGRRPRPENVLEAQIQNGDTLQAIALRYNCTISDIKRLNKIEKEIEIHARNTLKVPMNAHTLLLSTSNIDVLPIVHKSGQSSPKHTSSLPINSYSSSDCSTQNTSHPNKHEMQSDERLKLDEKLLIASVNLATSNDISNNIELATISATTPNTSQPNSLNGITYARKYTDDINQDERESFFNDPLMAHLDSSPHVIRGTPKNDLSCSGSDCDISWICLLVCILALCFAIPLIYVIYIAEHPEKFNHTDSA